MKLHLPYILELIMKKRIRSAQCLSVFLLLLLPFANYAQDTNDDDIEKIVIEGQSGDIALQAFNSGDFAKAEIEFKKNAQCALRLENNNRAFIDGLQNAQNNQLTRSQTNQANSSNLNSSFGGSGRNKRTNETRQRTCNDRGFQLYMVALSQLQLGRVEEAEKNLKTAAFLNKDLYDAHYRLGLMELLRDDSKSAKKHLKKIKKILKRCDECEAEEEIVAQVNFLDKAVKGEIKLK